MERTRIAALPRQARVGSRAFRPRLGLLIPSDLDVSTFHRRRRSFASGVGGKSPFGDGGDHCRPVVDDPTTGRLRFIYVRQTARRRGIADRMVGDCLALARGRWRTLRLHTDNAFAARLYERHGFQPSASNPRATHTMALAST